MKPGRCCSWASQNLSLKHIDGSPILLDWEAIAGGQAFLHARESAAARTGTLELVMTNAYSMMTDRQGVMTTVKVMQWQDS